MICEAPCTPPGNQANVCWWRRADDERRCSSPPHRLSYIAIANPPRHSLNEGVERRGADTLNDQDSSWWWRYRMISICAKTRMCGAYLVLPQSGSLSWTSVFVTLSLSHRRVPVPGKRVPDCSFGSLAGAWLRFFLLERILLQLSISHTAPMWKEVKMCISTSQAECLIWTGGRRDGGSGKRAHRGHGWNCNFQEMRADEMIADAPTEARARARARVRARAHQTPSPGHRRHAINVVDGPWQLEKDDQTRARGLSGTTWTCSNIRP